MTDITTLAVPARTEVPLVQGISTNFAAGGKTALQLLQQLRRDCGVSGSDPTSITNLSGEMNRLLGYMNNAWIEIQSMHPDWEFMRQPVQFNTVATQAKYTTTEQLISSFADYKYDSFRVYPVDHPEGEQILPFMPYNEFRDMYLFGAMRTQQSNPLVFTVSPQRDMILGPVPNGAYTVNGECYAMPTGFTNDSDRPAMPPQFHMAIVYVAMMKYGAYEAAPETYDQGQTESRNMLAKLAADQLPQLTFGPPLA